MRKNERFFLISIDTEGDDQWSWVPGKEITTENSLFLPRFQELCEKYGFKPTYLTNYEMAKEDRFVNFFKPKAQKGLCEIGMHLHAWNCPPEHQLKNTKPVKEGQCPYLIEYTDDIMRQKIETMTGILSNVFELPITTHRAGRWAMDDRYFRLLEYYGYKVDCSVTPGVNWNNCPGSTFGSVGSDYTDESEKPHQVGSILEVPMTVRHLHRFAAKETGSAREFLGRLHGYISVKHELWLRPNGRNLDDMRYLVDHCLKAGDGYIMFMIHSSELMPGGCWRFDTEEKIEKLYRDMDDLFSYISKSYKGITIGEYGSYISNHNYF